MNTSSNIVAVEILPEEYEICYQNALLACPNFASRFQETRIRPETDKLVGQIGEAAGSKWFLGNEGFRLYQKTREHVNKNPHNGDGGTDLLGYKINFKTSMIRSAKPLDTYNLVLRPAERHDDVVYVQLLVTPDLKGAFILGWLDEKNMTKKPVDHGIFKGAYVTGFEYLHSPETLPTHIL